MSIWKFTVDLMVNHPASLDNYFFFSSVFFWFMFCKTKQNHTGCCKFEVMHIKRFYFLSYKYTYTCEFRCLFIISYLNYLTYFEFLVRRKKKPKNQNKQTKNLVIRPFGKKNNIPPFSRIVLNPRRVLLYKLCATLKIRAPNSKQDNRLSIFNFKFKRIGYSFVSIYTVLISLIAAILESELF